LKRIGRAGGDGEEAVRAVYRTLPSISIDHAVMERVDPGRLAVIPIDVGWSDVGSWSALQEILPGDRRGNVIRGNVIEMGCEDSVLYADKRAVAVIGVSGMVVVDTPDATLVCPKDRSQEVRAVVDVLRKRKAEEHMTPKTVERPWGNYTVLESGPGYKIKRIEVRSGRRLSLQLHHRRCEHWVVIRGTARVTRNDEVFDVPMEESTYIPKGARHRLENPGSGLLEIIEVQNGDYLGEDDIVRFQDDYGRKLK
jgi:mannose-1-phosphate guanylyltransferase/mannose-6-phosphate isomerase